ncbi:ABC transporter substrate-binding protein [Cryptosporangium arvum]|uniref:ABC transporter substrate-binding protein n=1 Tax=Cryptosporangium arvum TaxID=80871 RepID=UPI0004B098ED|nr:ABC transporter substrate-binding protein [Cryptosporangium arvum]
MNKIARRRLAATLLLALAPALVTACSSDDDTAVSGANTATAAPKGSAQDLSDVCPATVVVQADWEPEAEHSAAYALIGAGYTVDAGKKRVKGPLVSGGMDTGVDVEVRAGGAAIGFQSVTSQMYVDQDILLGLVTTDQAISASGKQPVTAVVAPLNKSPQMLMWDPKTYPDVKTVADLGKKKASIVVSEGTLYAELLVKNGLITKSQLDTSYDGAPARFVGDPKIAQQGFATAEPYIYEKEVRAWGKPVAYQLLADVGYSVYPEPLSVRTGDLEKNAPCLKKLVPILQRAQIDYLERPDTTNALIVDVVEKYDDGWTYSEGVAKYAAKTMADLKIVADDTSGPLGGMDPARVQQTIDTFAPLLQASGGTPKAGLKAADIIDTRFLDKSVTLP